MYGCVNYHFTISNVGPWDNGFYNSASSSLVFCPSLSIAKNRLLILHVESNPTLSIGKIELVHTSELLGCVCNGHE
jgi:hypothetical protein